MSSALRTSLKFAIIGHPIAHALSPVMQNAAFRALGLPHRYDAIDITPNDLAQRIQRLRIEGYAGLNVTFPHKERILPLLDELSPEARAMGAVNAITVSGEAWRGHNTDVIGAVESLRQHARDLRMQTAVVLGAGGAARAVLYGLSRTIGMKRIIIASRTERRGLQLASELAIPDCSLTAVPFDATAIASSLQDAALLVNATPIGMFPDTDLSPLPGGIALRTHLIVFDVIYRPVRTSLIRMAESAGCRTIGGTEMLIRQGAAAFNLWTGLTMPVEPVRQALGQYLSPAGGD